MRKELYFTPENVENLKGVFNTCRLGDKWSKVSPGTMLDFKETGTEKFLGNGFVLFSVSGKYKTLSHVHAMANHQYQSYFSLEYAMIDAYGDDFSEESIVTYLYIKSCK